jgi:hypothetical protein
MAEVYAIGNGQKIPDDVQLTDVPAEGVLNGAVKADLEHVVITGWTGAGEFFFATSYASDADTLWLLKMAEKYLFETDDDD